MTEFDDHVQRLEHAVAALFHVCSLIGSERVRVTIETDNDEAFGKWRDIVDAVRRSDVLNVQRFGS